MPLQKTWQKLQALSRAGLRDRSRVALRDLRTDLTTRDLTSSNLHFGKEKMSRKKSGSSFFCPHLSTKSETLFSPTIP